MLIFSYFAVHYPTGLLKRLFRSVFCSALSDWTTKEAL